MYLNSNGVDGFWHKKTKPDDFCPKLSIGHHSSRSVLTKVEADKFAQKQAFEAKMDKPLVEEKKAFLQIHPYRYPHKHFLQQIIQKAYLQVCVWQNRRKAC